MQYCSKTTNTKKNKLQAKKLSQMDEKKNGQTALSICTILSKILFEVEKSFTD